MKVGWCDLCPPSLLAAPFEPLKGVRCEKPEDSCTPPHPPTTLLLLLWALSGKLRSPFSTHFKCCGVRRSRGPVEVVQPGVGFHCFTRQSGLCVCGELLFIKTTNKEETCSNSDNTLKHTHRLTLIPRKDTYLHITVCKYVSECIRRGRKLKSVRNNTAKLER